MKGMHDMTSRRQFLAMSGAAALGLWGAGLATGQETGFKTKLQRAMIISKPDEKNLAPIKAAGFDGVEARIVTVEEAKAGRAAAEKLGLKIHSVMCGTDDPAAGIRAAHGFGADTILLVPGRLNLGSGGKGKKGGTAQTAIKVPETWEFDIDFDPKNGHLKRVVKGDNTPYAQYMAAHNQCIDDAVALVKSHIPLAEQLDVVIALENVWAFPWPHPDLMVNLVDLCGSKQVMAYFDVGNNMKYLTQPEVWIRKLDKRIRRIHIKDWKYLDAEKHTGKFVHPRDGDINWPAVRKALEDVGYNGFCTIEDGGLELKDFRERLDLIIAGK